MSFESSSVVANKSCTWKEIGNQVIILQSESVPPLTHELNETGSFVWLLLQDGAKSFNSVLESLTKTFDVPSAEAQADLVHLLNELESKSLIRRVD